MNAEGALATTPTLADRTGVAGGECGYLEQRYYEIFRRDASPPPRRDDRGYGDRGGSSYGRDRGQCFVVNSQLFHHLYFGVLLLLGNFNIFEQLFVCSLFHLKVDEIQF